MPWYESVTIIPFEDKWENSIERAKQEICCLSDQRKIA